ncbi:Por secretion system C-terminal sorting domain-containing protein [Reichenbachiella faecimaris]|uniref:Por secretion system C-terminal sorting domain-containing protein n=1 Tax=Reichenbachiella faecimaris TaxID=692418 RepID=A0A1W2GNQ0_REIFA|nr:T9SS type A sorting domain-containing protein [Reichenbachiella faecimaris]SMD38283.1 Por secretion system C-terminal sorting domain-containing protein [Reichenbachiella faecimaris]
MKKLLLLILIVLTYGGRAQTFEPHGPKTFVEILDQTFDVSWTPSGISAIENLKHVIILDADTQTDALMLDDVSTTSLSFKSKDHLSSSTATYSSLLHGMFQLVDINSNTEDELAGQYRIHPLLNSYAALNADGTDAVITDAGSYYVDATGGYLVFELGGSATSTTIKAVAQYEYNTTSGEFEANSGWTDQWLIVSGENVQFTSTEGNASAFYLANAHDLIDFSLEPGSAFNPSSIEWQDNAFAAYPDEVWDYDESALFGEQFLSEVDEAYQTQFGNTDAANTAASEALDEIETTLDEDGATLRYDKSVYLTFRDNLLARTFGANDIYNGKIGESTVEYVYFTNAADGDGVRHPFMVIASHNASDGPNFLIDVARPPGDGEGGGYDEQSITRNAILEVKLVKIPLKDYGLIEELTDNDLTPYGSLASDLNIDASEYDVYNYSGTSSNGVAIDGVVIYPSYNNNLRVAAADAEITSTGIHVGRGMGLHYHADGHGYNGNGINLYNESDYVDQDHPPLIGFSYDGIALFGKYEDGYSDMEGFGDELDDFGGHDHSSFGYHYHAFGGDITYEDQDGNTVGPFTQHHLLVGAWKGDINDIPGFNEGSTAQLKEDDIGRFAGASYDDSGDPDDPDNPDDPEEPVLGFEGEPLDQLKIYPNPSAGTFTVEAPHVDRLVLLNLNGEMLQSRLVTNGKVKFQLKASYKGILILKGEGTDRSFVQKIILK